MLRAVALSAWHVLPLDWAVHDAELTAALFEAVREGPRRRLWKCSDPLRRRRPDWNPKRIYCVYKAMMLNLHRPAKRRFLKCERMPRNVPRLPDIVWSADFMSDALACGRRFRTFNLIDDSNREALHIAVDTSINAQPLIRVFECLQPGLPQVLHTDNEPEFRGEAFVACAEVPRLGHPVLPAREAQPERLHQCFNRTFPKRYWTGTCSLAWATSGRQLGGGCSGTTRDDPMTRSAG